MFSCCGLETFFFNVFCQNNIKCTFLVVIGWKLFNVFSQIKMLIAIGIFISMTIPSNKFWSDIYWAILVALSYLICTVNLKFKRLDIVTFNWQIVFSCDFFKLFSYASCSGSKKFLEWDFDYQKYFLSQTKLCLE